nr:hypothetical protein [Tanacetum cinerariifolium]
EITKLKQRVKKPEKRNKLKDVVLEDAKDVAADAKVDQDAEVDESADIQGRKAESQIEIYKIDLDHVNKMDYFKGMSYDDIRPVFEKYFDSNVAFLQKKKEKMDEEDSKALKRLNKITGSCYIFSPSGRSVHNYLLLALPRDQSASKELTSSGCRLPI